VMMTLNGNVNICGGYFLYFDDTLHEKRSENPN
jgi:hypothetical protein